MGRLKNIAWSFMMVIVVSIGSFVFFGLLQEKAAVGTSVNSSGIVPLGVQSIFLSFLILAALIVTRFVLKRGLDE